MQFTVFMAAVACLVMGSTPFETVLPFEPWPCEGKRLIMLSMTKTAIPAATKGEAEVFDAPEALEKKLRPEGIHRVYLDGGNTNQGFLHAGLVRELAVDQQHTTA